MRLTPQQRLFAMAALAIAFALAPAFALAQSSLYTTSTAIRAPLVLTTSDAITTTFTVPQDAKAVIFYTDLTLGSLTSGTFTPAGARDNNPAATGYFKAVAHERTFTADNRSVIRVPRAELGAYRYAGVFCRGAGTVTGSSASVRYKIEY